MDMDTGFELEVRLHCQHAAIVFDLFHVVAKYGREVIDRVRVDRGNQLSTGHARCKFVKGVRGRLLLKNRDSLYPGEEVTLEELLEANRGLFVVYVMRDAFQGAMALPPPRLRPAHCRYPCSTNLIEGINNKMEVIKRTAQGFRDDAWFVLKILAGFPGVGR